LSSSNRGGVPLPLCNSFGQPVSGFEVKERRDRLADDPSPARRDEGPSSHQFRLLPTEALAPLVGALLVSLSGID